MNAAQARVRKVLLGIDGVVEGESAFGEGAGFWVNGKQVAHFRDDEVMELRLTKPAIRAQRDRLRADARIELRQGASEWVKIHVARPGDIALVTELAEAAAAAHRAPGGATPAPPPAGVDLARRRRFH